MAEEAVLNGLAILAGAYLLGLSAWISCERRRAPSLPEDFLPPEPTVVLLPVRNEETHLLDCLAGLRQQEGIEEIRIIDDESRDRTADLAAEIAREDSRVRLVQARPLPAGWGGKVNALESGWQLGFAEDIRWVLLTDADTRHGLTLVARAQQAAREHGLSAISLAGHQANPTPGVALVGPPVFALLDALLGSWQKQARGDGRRSIANGQFFLLRREALASIGGPGAVAGELLDDVALAEALRRKGYRVGFWRAGTLLEARMYPSFLEAVRGWRRNLALYLGRQRFLFARTILALLLPLACSIAALGAGVTGALAPGYLAGFLSSVLLRPRAGRFWAILWPIELGVLLGLVLLAARDRARGWTTWRGRRILVREPDGDPRGLQERV